MKVAIYLRKSRENQDLQTQRTMITEHCKRNDYIIYRIYKDTISGKTDSRPEFNKLIYDMRHHRFHLIIVYKIDRICRSLQHFLQLIQEFENLGIKFISITQNIDTNSSESRMMMRMLMIFAEYEREIIVARTKDTLDRYKRDIKKQGYFINRDGKRVHQLGRPRKTIKS